MNFRIILFFLRQNLDRECIESEDQFGKFEYQFDIAQVAASFWLIFRVPNKLILTIFAQIFIVFMEERNAEFFSPSFLLISLL